MTANSSSISSWGTSASVKRALHVSIHPHVSFHVILSLLQTYFLPPLIACVRRPIQVLQGEVMLHYRQPRIAIHWKQR